jgi:hypothetical protein
LENEVAAASAQVRSNLNVIHREVSVMVAGSLRPGSAGVTNEVLVFTLP